MVYKIGVISETYHIGFKQTQCQLIWMEKVVAKQPEAQNSEMVRTVTCGEIGAEISAAELAWI